MKKLICLFSVLFVFNSCSDSIEDGFEEANPDVSEKYLKKVEIVSDEDGLEGSNTFNYNSVNKLSSITNGKESQFFNYSENDALISITGSENFYMDELDGTPVKAYEWGNVLKYDDKRNPTKIELLEDNNDVYIANISYDDKPNPYFYTIKAAGLIDILDDIYLDFGYVPQELQKARELIPYNYFSSIIIKNVQGQTIAEVQFDNTYDDDDYLTISNVLVLSDDETSSTYFRYFYK